MIKLQRLDSQYSLSISSYSTVSLVIHWYSLCSLSFLTVEPEVHDCCFLRPSLLVFIICPSDMTLLGCCFSSLLDLNLNWNVKKTPQYHTMFMMELIIYKSNIQYVNWIIRTNGLDSTECADRSNVIFMKYKSILGIFALHFYRPASGYFFMNSTFDGVRKNFHSILSLEFRSWVSDRK